MKSLLEIKENIAYKKQRSHRIEALADGVFAIAMTLLVLDVRVPLGEINTEQAIWLSLVQVFPKIFAFVLSFLVAGLFWTVFENQFNYIHTADRNENVIAIFYLLMISFLPFSASFLSEHIESKVAVGFYISNILMLALVLTFHWQYCYHFGLVSSEGVDIKIIHKTLMRRAKTAIIIYSAAGICCVFSTYVALGIIILIQMFFFLSGFIEIMKKRRPKSNP